MFPSLTVNNTSISSLRRVLLCNRTRITSETGDQIDVIDIRHFSISTKPVAVPRSVRKTSVTSNVVNLSKFDDVADFVMANGYESTSEIDEDERVSVTTPSRQEGLETQQRAIKLNEIGPRLRIELIKIEEGMCDGKVLYHRYITKTKREEKKLDERHKLKAEEAAKRRKVQEANVARRKAEKEARSQQRPGNKVEEMEIEEDEEEDSSDDEEALMELEDELTRL
jgi:ribosome biogenesis protein SSF1/2